MSDVPIRDFLQRVSARLTRQPQQLEVINDYQPRAPGTHSDFQITADSSLGTTQRISATLENDLTITMFSALTCTVSLTGIVRRPDGSTQPIGPNGAGFLVSVIGDRVPRSVTFPRGSGVDVIGLSVIVSSATVVSLGSVWAIVQTSRTLADGTQAITSTLVSGPVSTSQALGWPGSPVLASINSPYQRASLLTTPGVGQNVVITVPTGARWELIALTGVFVVGGVAGAVSFQLLTALQAFTKIIVEENVNAPAGSTQSYTIGVGLATAVAADGVTRSIGWPFNVGMLAGDVMRLQSALAASQWSTPFLTVLERLDP